MTAPIAIDTQVGNRRWVELALNPNATTELRYRMPPNEARALAQMLLDSARACEYVNAIIEDEEQAEREAEYEARLDSIAYPHVDFPPK